MLCPNCNRPLPDGSNHCPGCGAGPSARQSGVMKTSTILIASEGASGVFHSMEELPDSLRQKLLKSTNGLNAATILIADRRGREEIAKAIRKLSSFRQRRLFRSVLGDVLGGSDCRPCLPLRIPRLIGALLAGGGLLFWLLSLRNW